MLSIIFGIVLCTSGGQILSTSGCEVVSNSSGLITSEDSYFESPISLCWQIAVPEGHYIDLLVTNWSTYSATISGKVETRGNTVTLDSTYLKKPILIFDDVTISISVSKSYYYGSYSSYEFTMSYKIVPTSGCEVVSNSSGLITSADSYFASPISLCWKIAVPDGQYVDLLVTKWSTYSAMMSGKVETRGNTGTLDSSFVKKHIVLFDDAKISISVSKSYYYYASYEFIMSYKIEDLVCGRGDSVRCGNDSCVPRDKACDGVKDCDDGKDEENCKFDRELVEGVDVSLAKGVSWLRGEMKGASRAWRRDTPRAITALYLAEGVAFDGTCDEDETLVRELEIKTAVAVMRNAADPVLPVDLAVLIHGLLVACYDPRHFYGFDLVRMLDDLVAGSPNGTAQPLASLALCNAGQLATKAQVQGLLSILGSPSAHPFLLDVQAVALMALSCINNNDDNPDFDEDIDLVIHKTATRFQNLQRYDGSFGDIYTTAFVAQALMGANDRANHRANDSATWRESSTLKYLMKQQAKDSSFGDFLATYLVLPILNDRSLVDIAKVHCSPNKTRPKEEDLLPDKDKKPDPMMTVKYSLYVGEEPDVVPTVALRMPYHRNAYQVMQAAAEANPKFKFECHWTMDKMYVFSISGIANDPEFDKFWLFYIDRKNNGTMELITDSPETTMVNDGEHIIMWYKKTTIL